MNTLDRLIYVQGWHRALVERLNTQCAKLGLVGDAKLVFAQRAADSENLSGLRGGDMELDAIFAAAFGFDSKGEMEEFARTIVLDPKKDIQESKDSPSPGM